MKKVLSKAEESRLIARVKDARQKRDYAYEDASLAASRLADAIRDAMDGGLSVRRIANHIGMSPARVHQISQS